MHIHKRGSVYLLAIVISQMACFATPLFGQTQGFYDEKTTAASQAELTISNIGKIGNAFRGSYQAENRPSAEFPKGSSIEHLFEGGFWVGGYVNGQPLVTTAAFSASSGYTTGGANYEFTAPIGSQLDVRSSLRGNENYTPNAVSHEDFVADFTDRNTIVPGTNLPVGNGSHTPLGIDVHMETYNWNFNFANFFVIFDFTIVNNGSQTIDSVYTGYWADFVVRNTNLTPPGGTPFFNKGGNAFIDSLQMFYEWDQAGDIGFTETYGGIKFLGSEDENGFHHPRTDSTFKVNYSAWLFNTPADPVFNQPGNDDARYRKMAESLTEYSQWNSSNPAINIQKRLAGPNNFSSLLSGGPHRSFAPGDTIKVAYAMVFARKGATNSDSVNSITQRIPLISNAQWTQTTYNGEDVNGNGILDAGEDQNGNGKLDRYRLPSPPEVPETRFVIRDNAVDIYWTDNAERSIDPITNEQDFEGYKIYHSKLGFDQTGGAIEADSLMQVAAFDKPDNEYFYNTGFGSVRLEEAITFEEDPNNYTYKFTLDNLQNGWQHVIALTAFDRGDGDANVASLETAVETNLVRAFPGTPPSESSNEEPFVYPNPYYGSAAWEGNSSREEDRRLMFANLPKRAIVRIFTTAGDFINQFEHDASYNGTGSLWYDTYSNPDQNKLSGGEHAWDLLSSNNQIIARGLYIFTVEDLDSGEIHKGRFVIIR